MIYMKKRYSTPLTIEIELQTEPLMTAVSGEQGNSGVGSGTAGDGDPDLGSRRRGVWGDLWCE